MKWCVHTPYLCVPVFLTFCDIVSPKLASSPSDQQESIRAFRRSLDDGGYGPTLALILQDYILINTTGTIAWSNPAYTYYDQQLIIAIQQQLEAESVQDYNDHYHLQADHGSSLLPLYGGLKFLTYYCGPGNWSVDGNTVQNSYFTSIDQCCKQHDECPDTIVDRRDYSRYQHLPYKAQIFTRLKCSCDVAFLKCLQHISTFFSYAVAWIYTKFQSNCFDYEHPVMECTTKKNDGIFTSERCLSYLVDNSYSKRWQWFDIPYISSNQLLFPEVENRYDLDWFNILFAKEASRTAKRPDAS